MVEVRELDLKVESPETVIWISKRAQKELGDLGNNDLLGKLEDCSERGFKHFVGSAVRSEPAGTWRFGIRSSTVRVAGFFEDDTTKASFVVLRVFKAKKKGNANTPAENAIYGEIGGVKRDGGYRKEAGHWE